MNFARMKTLTFSLVATMIFGALLFNSCTDDPCLTFVCENGGTCIVNEFDLPECDCLDGFEGDNCDVEVLCFDVTCPDNVTADSPLYDEIDDACYCYCNDGYEGENCDQLIREKYLGQYSGEDVCGTETYPIYTANIVPSTVDDKRFIINGFGGFDLIPANVICEIVDANQFQLIRLVSPDGAGNRVIEGVTWGTINPDTGIISVTWKVDYPDNTFEECTSILTPQ